MNGQSYLGAINTRPFYADFPELAGVSEDALRFSLGLMLAGMSCGELRKHPLNVVPYQTLKQIREHDEYQVYRRSSFRQAAVRLHQTNIDAAQSAVMLLEEAAHGDIDGVGSADRQHDARKILATLGHKSTEWMMKYDAFVEVNERLERIEEATQTDS